MRSTFVALSIALAAAGAGAAVQAQMPGAADVSRVQAGTYKTDANHTQVVWSVNHLGFSTLYGMFGAKSGTLTIDPKNPSAAKVNIEFSTADLNATSPQFSTHLKSGDFFDVAKFPTATFTSTSVQASGTSAKIAGNLTIKGVTKPVTLDAKLMGAGANPMSKAQTIGFTATATVKRTDFGLGMAAPAVGDDVTLHITAAFEKTA
jgi:polyisoprenoid-binding protein YceI